MSQLLKKTKIVATIGPASSSRAVIRQMIHAGVNVFRVNLSHGTQEEHGQRIKLIRETAAESAAQVGILADLQGPKIRTGITEGNKPVTLRKGFAITLTTRKVINTDSVISIDYPKLLSEIRQGQELMINDGAVRLRIISIDMRARLAHCKILNTGVYSSHKGVNFPNASLKVPSMTAKDRRDLRFILTQPVDYIALSFVRAAHDLKALNSAIVRAGNRIKTIAKIEKPEAAADIERILDACDGIMVARGDLGVETSPYEVPQLQKDLVLKGNRKGKLVIVATQMLESMIEHPLPTRAESTDVANAILDGTDACMLSGETAVGAYPVESVLTMSRIAQAIEASSYFGSGGPVNLNLEEHSGSRSVCEAAAWASRDLGGVPVLVFTMSGDTALYMAKIRSQSPIIAVSPRPEVVSMLSLAWNVRAFYVPFERDVVSLQKHTESLLVRKGIFRKKQQIVVLCGTTPVRGATNFMRVKEVG